MRNTNPISYRCLAVALAATGLTLAGAASAQTVDELTVTGVYGSEAQRLSAVVSYADLDLTTESGADTLKSRISTTARDLCMKLGETNATSDSLVPSCERDARENAWNQAKDVIASATPRTMATAAPMSSPAPAPMAATSTTADVSASAPASVTYTNQLVTNGPVPDTAENRARFGGPMSHAGQRTAPAGN